MPKPRKRQSPDCKARVALEVIRWPKTTARLAGALQTGCRCFAPRTGSRETARSSNPGAVRPRWSRPMRPAQAVFELGDTRLIRGLDAAVLVAGLPAVVVPFTQSCCLVLRWPCLLAGVFFSTQA
jgi:hypothetical protein